MMKPTFVFTSKIRIIIATIRKVFYGEGDHEPGKEPGDIIIQMEEKEHAVFQRHGEISWLCCLHELRPQRCFGFRPGPCHEVGH